MSLHHTYLPQDRQRALARNETLPDRTTGSALFADISGFTPLTEGLRDLLGPRRGAEELTRHLDAVYSALIAEVERYGGSVIGFAGDAITCWFDEQRLKDEGRRPNEASPSSRAVTCALALQQAMLTFSSIALPNGTTTALALKVSIASGPARRFVVGDPAIHYIDALAGATVARTSTAEHLATRGDVLVDEATAHMLGAALTVTGWRTDHDSGECFAVVEKYGETIAPLQQACVPELSIEQLRDWLHKSQVDRQPSFLTEFRPCAALFVRFSGIDYDADDAQAQLDAFIRQLQSIISHYEGTLIQLTIGDKGSYAYLDFGALSAHEDDARRAVKAALELEKAAAGLGFVAPVQIGLTQGTLRVGAYGGPTRKAFGALGDEVNLAARLMQTAAAGEILVSGNVHKAVEAYFVLEPRPPLPMKGKAEPLPVFAVTGERKQRAIRLQEPTYALPMVGRQHELQIISEKLDLALTGQLQVIGIVAEAGLGKSRLVAEAIRAARKKGFAGYGGACQSDAIHTPYQTWKMIWSAFFDVDPELPLRKQLRLLAGEIEDRVPERVEALPLLGTLLNLEIPDNDFTRTLEPQYRKSTLHALLEDCLRAATNDGPLLIVIEDLHWIDALSHELLEELAKALANCPLVLLVAYRPPHTERTRLVGQRLEALPTFTQIELHELTRAEAEQAIRAKLLQLYPARSGAIPIGLVDTLMARAQGNPFYLEELLNFLHDRSLDPRDPTALKKIELPDSLHALVLSRLDQLSDSQQITLRVASIIGRVFRAAWLTGYYPALGEWPRVKVDLDRLRALEITPLDSPEPELAYLFKHIVVHEVTYESLPFAMRAQLHEQLAIYLERQIAAGALPEAPLLDTLVYHYAHSENRAQQRTYLQKAGSAALDVSAFQTAVEYLTRLLEITPETDAARSALALQLAEAHRCLGDFSAARAAIQQAQAAARTEADRASALAMLAYMTSEMGDYAGAETILVEAVPLARASGDQLTLCRSLSALGYVNWRVGKLADARAAQEESLALARALGDLTGELFALHRLGAVADMQGNLAEAEQLYIEVHTRAVAAGNRERAMMALNNLGVVAYERRAVAAARDYIQQTLTLARAIGAQSTIVLSLIGLAGFDIDAGQLPAVRSGLREALALALRLGTLPQVVTAVAYFAELAYAEGQTARALALYGLARRHPAWSSDDQRSLDTTLAQWALDPFVVEAGLAKGAELDWEKTIQELVKG